jgi:hypothetical protein
MSEKRPKGPPGKTHTKPTGRPPKKRYDAAVWLQAYLSGGQRPATDIQAVGATQGYSLALLRQRKKELSIISVQAGDQWFWRRIDVALPVIPAEPSLTDVIKAVNDIRTVIPIQASQGLPQTPEQPLPEPPDKEAIARLTAELTARADRQAELDNIIQAPNPFDTLLTRSQPAAIQHMLMIVRNHKANLESKREPIWEETTVEVSVPKKENGEEVVELIDGKERLVMVKEIRKSRNITGYKPLPENVAVEIAKWDSWIKQAKAQMMTTKVLVITNPFA